VQQEKVLQKKVRQENSGRKSAIEKLWQENHSRKSAAEKPWQKKVLQKNRGRKSATEKPQQKKCCRKTVTEKSRQQNATRRKRYGFHMCSVELMNLVEVFPCKYVGCPLGSLGILVELI
jgi:regulator of replication initiation timing